jgi:3D (Asp-Asp-Asp) domain-containing protein
MAAPAIAGKLLASVAADTARARAQSSGGAPPPKRGRGLVWLIAAVLALLVVGPALIVAVLMGGAQDAECAPDGLPAGSWTGPGSLGGVAGTGVTQAEVNAARRIRGLGGTRVTPGTYSPTAYLPSPHAPKINCGLTCSATASGIRVDNARRRAYLIASNPALNQYGALAYVWPNPYAWPGPFVVADSGSAFQGPGRLDFYVFINVGETWRQALARAYQWGPATNVTLSATPIQSGGPNITIPAAEAGSGSGAPAVAAAAGACAAAVDGELGARIARIAARYVGAGPSIPAFTPPTTQLSWCAWFASNVWRQAGVPMQVTFFSAGPYTYGLEHQTLFKTPGRPPHGITPPLGAALMYGTGPQSTSTSVHVNLVTAVNPDGTFMTIGGNEGGHVALSGPCRLTTGPATRLQGPGCDSRPVYAISAPGALT